MSAIKLQTHLRLKRLEKSDGGRWLIGTATTPTTDRHGDVVKPEGAQYRLPLILLFAHDHARPVGSVIEANVSHDRITVKAKLVENTRDSDEVWSLLQAGTPLALSIGFQALETKPLPSGGTEFTRWDWHELSIVAVPANADARLTVGKGVVQRSGSAVHTQSPDSRPVSTGFNPEMFGRAVGEAIKEATEPLRARITALEAKR